MEIVYTETQQKRLLAQKKVAEDYKKLREDNPTVSRNRILHTLAKKYGYKTPQSIWTILKKQGVL